MAAVFHTPITPGAPGNSDTVNDPLQELDDALQVAHNADGTIKANAVTATTIAAAVAGSGLAGGAGTALSVNVDGSTLEINSDTLRQKDGGTTAAKLAATALTSPNIIWDPFNELYAPGVDFDGKLRWRNHTAITLVNPDASNPTGNPTLRFDPAVSGAAAKHVYLSEAGIVVGDVLNLAVRIKGTATETGRLSARFYDASDVALAAQLNGTTVAFTGSAQTLTLLASTVPATAVYVAIFPNRVSGSNTFDVYDWWGTRSDYLPATATKTATDPAQRAMHTIDGVVWDVLNADRTPGTDFGARSRWVNSSQLSIVTPDAFNIYGSKTLHMAYAASPAFAGKWLYFDEIGAAVGDQFAFNAKVRGASGTGRLACRFYDVSGVAVGAQVNGPIRTFDTLITTLTAKSGVIPATAVSVKVYVVRSTGTADIDIYSLSGRLQSPLGVPHHPANPIDWVQEIRDARGGQTTLLAGITAASAGATAFPASQDTYGRHFLRSWNGQIAKVQQAVATEQAVIAVFGDSWVNNNFITGPLTSWLQTTYGNAGPGWASFNTAAADPTGITTVSNSGTWTESDQDPTSRGVDIMHVSSSDTASPGKRTRSGTFTDVVIHYLKQSGGGDFRWKIDAGAWTTVATANATNLFATETISGLSNASHTLYIEILNAGSSGCILMGADFKITPANGVRVHKVGNGGLTGGQAVAVDATIWQAGLAALAPHLVVILLGTNDDSADVVPATFGTQIATLVSRIRTAVPTADILLLSPTANGLADGTYTTDLYIAQLRAQAVALNTAMVDFYLHLPLWTDLTGRGLNGTGPHLNASGGQFAANLLDRFLRAP
jgi:hypothetical protein